MSDLEMFLKSYWEYYLELEKQFSETKRFVEFDKANSRAYSIEYLKLYQAVCSEIDVVGKEIAVALNPQFKIDNNTNIKKWGYEIQKKFPTMKNIVVQFNGDEHVQPFKNWEYELTRHSNGRTGLKLKDDKKAILWWTNYNSIKHRRIGLVEGTKNFQLANQSNLILAFSALFILETLYINSFSKSNFMKKKESNLFSLIETTESSIK